MKCKSALIVSLSALRWSNFEVLNFLFSGFNTSDTLTFSKIQMSPQYEVYVFREQNFSDRGFDPDHDRRETVILSVLWEGNFLVRFLQED